MRDEEKAVPLTLELAGANGATSSDVGAVVTETMLIDDSLFARSIAATPNL
jgi:hypothetical protein